MYSHADITVRHGDIINPIQSARIRTLKSFSFVYGTVEVRAKMPRGDWLWRKFVNIFKFIISFNFYCFFIYLILYFLCLLNVAINGSIQNKGVP